jgi:hypothetical protein
VLNDVVLNQVPVRFHPEDGEDDEARHRSTQDVIRRVQADGSCWTSETSWQGRAALRISVTNWSAGTHGRTPARAAGECVAPGFRFSPMPWRR